MKSRKIWVWLIVASVAVLGVISTGRAVPVDGSGPGPRTADPATQALAYIEAGQPKLAIDLLKKALAKTPDSARLNYYLGLAYTADKRPALAETRFRAALREDPDYIDAHIRIAELMASVISPDLSDAKNLILCRKIINELSAALKRSPEDTGLLFRLARANLRCVSFDKTGADTHFIEATKLLAKVAGLEPNEPKPYFSLANVYLAQARRAADGKRLSELKGAKARQVTDLLGKAEAHLRKALELNPRLLRALDQVAAVHAQRGDVKAAIKVYEEHLPKLEAPARKAACHRQIGVYLLQAKDTKAAAASFAKAIEVHKSDMGSYILLARVLLSEKDDAGAFAALQKAIEVRPGFLNALVELGQIELARGNRGSAEKYFAQAIQTPPNRAVAVSTGGVPPRVVMRNLYVRAATRLGQLLVARSQFDDAVGVYRRLGQLLPRSPVPDFHIGNVYRQQGKFKEARQWYANALRKNKDFASARVALGEMAVAESNAAFTKAEKAQILANAIDQFDLAIKAKPEDPALLSRVAALRVSRAKLSDPVDRAELKRALENVQAAVKLRPQSQGLRAQLAGIYHELGQKKEAIAELDAVIAKAKERLEAQPEAVTAILDLAQLRARRHAWEPNKEMYKEALAGFELAIKKDPGLLLAYNQASTLVYSDKDYKAAVDWYKRLYAAAAGKKKPGQMAPFERAFALHASAQIAWTACEYLNDLETASEYAALALKLDPNLPALLDTQGWIYYKQGEFSKAIPPLRRAFKSAPSNPTIGHHLGATLMKLKNPKRAREVLRQARRNAGGNKKLLAEIEKLLKLAGD